MPTTTATHTGPQSAEFMAQVLYPPRRITVDQYHKLLEIGYLEHGDPIELLEGYMVHKMPRGFPHDRVLDRLDRFLVPKLTDPWFARSQRAITIPTDGEPEPDLAVVRGPMDRFTDHPRPDDIGLLVEAADSSLGFDRFDKARLYAEAGIPVYWIVNIPDRQIEVLTRPAGPGYVQRDVYPAGSTVPVVLDGVQVGAVAVADIIP
ncbi:MAG: Uma2 family endonuclease [Gemmataceae bacterium]|nr:Uma2 family endonuclease [Gemmataceae bacterium]